ncbi:WhiB family transcriptional regulator [Streptomyces sp. BI20]|uniref:WhiB family transcriptional regulator n=1 Tax=Streptomyces sp. BI20 TaxID=3403460 RepID=UPI003C76B3AA
MTTHSTVRPPGAAEAHWQWQEEAACRRLGSSLFFHPAGERGEEREERDRAAKEICALCPVRERCLRHALAVGEPYGVWGGLTEEERRAVTTGAGRAAAGAGRSGPTRRARSAPGRSRPGRAAR